MWKNQKIKVGDLIWVWDDLNNCPKSALVVKKTNLQLDSSNIFEYLVLFPNNDLLYIPGIMIYKSYKKCKNGKFKTRFF